MNAQIYFNSEPNFTYPIELNSWKFKFYDDLRMGKNNRGRREKRETARERHKTRAEKKEKNSDDEDDELEKQLNLIGLALRETTADGNCLFR